MLQIPVENVQILDINNKKLCVIHCPQSWYRFVPFICLFHDGRKWIIPDGSMHYLGWINSNNIGLGWI